MEGWCISIFLSFCSWRRGWCVIRNGERQGVLGGGGGGGGTGRSVSRRKIPCSLLAAFFGSDLFPFVVSWLPAFLGGSVQGNAAGVSFRCTWGFGLVIQRFFYLAWYGRRSKGMPGLIPLRILVCVCASEAGRARRDGRGRGWERSRR
ncbi:hypothetical protein B0H63DRAFT_245495 [Podospora didyma]|uniref:Uncharacterized protein n=1 Tax=Podospora didyma TaxID=330526 RepID=A0AAE0JYE5_9PEZI|nr:hypothetical protein B0H63DRAFT_94475 [Podospora didyma]KAK3378362.1 hypothetical protein B0H63DRAFT_245495 [Podospora didyma]